MVGIINLLNQWELLWTVELQESGHLSKLNIKESTITAHLLQASCQHVLYYIWLNDLNISLMTWVVMKNNVEMCRDEMINDNKC